MPIVRTYFCPECAHQVEVTLAFDQWDAPPPSCEACDARELNQVFKPPAIGGSTRGRAVAIAENIIANDYGVANYTPDNREGGTGKIHYKDQTAGQGVSSWGPQLQQAIEIGRQTRLQHGNGLDILNRMLKTGEQPDLIEASKRRAIKVY